MGFEYTVNGNDKGLSYIFLDQAKKLDGFDESKQIDWNQVMNVFDEIQREKQSNNESLFSGGTDKTKKGYGSSYTIKKNDKIQLSDADLNKIYTAMGVDLNKSKGVKDKNPPQKGPDLSNKTATLTDIEKAGKKNIKDGETIINNNIVNYENGFVNSVRDKNNRTGRMFIRNNDGSINSFADFENDSKGNVIKKYTYDKNGKLTEALENVNGSNGKPIRTILRNPDGTVKDYTDWQYDSSGKTTKQTERNADGSISVIYDFEYDASGRQTKSIEKDANGNIKFYTIYSEWDPKTKEPTKGQKYDANGLLYNG